MPPLELLRNSSKSSFPGNLLSFLLLLLLPFLFLLFPLFTQVVSWPQQNIHKRRRGEGKERGPPSFSVSPPLLSLVPQAQSITPLTHTSASLGKQSQNGCVDEARERERTAPKAKTWTSAESLSISLSLCH